MTILVMLVFSATRKRRAQQARPSFYKLAISMGVLLWSFGTADEAELAPGFKCNNTNRM